MLKLKTMEQNKFPFEHVDDSFDFDHYDKDNYTLTSDGNEAIPANTILKRHGTNNHGFV